VSPPEYDHVRLSKAGAVATVAIDRPNARNTLVRGTGLELYDALGRVAADPDVRVLIFRGVGQDFCCGADLKSAEAPAGEKPAPAFNSYQVTLLLHEMRPLTVAAIRGGCAGAGFGWACACDLRVADTTAIFNTAFLDVGVAGDMGVPWSLPRIIGSGRARDLAFFPRKLDALEASGIGLVNRLWPAEQFEAELNSLVERLSAVAPLALTAMKANFIEAERMDLRSFISIEAERHVRLMNSEDRQEAFRAWLEKRPGRYRGR
jgi:2-(1,2-epoxy-1,2-dihydrophenyl)acetyl-CoA isomerase